MFCLIFKKQTKKTLTGCCSVSEKKSSDSLCKLYYLRHFIDMTPRKPDSYRIHTGNLLQNASVASFTSKPNKHSRWDSSHSPSAVRNSTTFSLGRLTPSLGLITPQEGVLIELVLDEIKSLLRIKCFFSLFKAICFFSSSSHLCTSPSTGLSQRGVFINRRKNLHRASVCGSEVKAASVYFPQSFLMFPF